MYSEHNLVHVEMLPNCKTAWNISSFSSLICPYQSILTCSFTIWSWKCFELCCNRTKYTGHSCWNVARLHRSLKYFKLLYKWVETQQSTFWQKKKIWFKVTAKCSWPLSWDYKNLQFGSKKFVLSCVATKPSYVKTTQFQHAAVSAKRSGKLTQRIISPHHTTAPVSFCSAQAKRG